MMPCRSLWCLVLTALLHLPFVSKAGAQAQPQTPLDLASRIQATTELPFRAEHLAARSGDHNFESGLISSVAVSDGLIYELQRGEKANPVLVLDKSGEIVKSWGRGDYKLPHSVRLDSVGNIWTVDAANSQVFKYSSTGNKLLTIDIGGQPKTKGPFSGATDIAFAPNGHLFITDGYGNARVIEYSPIGRRIRQWGAPGEGPGQFHLPHAIQISTDGVIYVADRENGRIEKFDINGKYLGEIPNLGRVYSLKLDGNIIWAGTQSLEQNTGAPGWIVKVDRHSGEMLGHLNVTKPFGLHSIDFTPAGDLVTSLGNEILLFRRKESAP